MKLETNCAEEESDIISDNGISWQPDSSSSHCGGCDKTFVLVYRRKHHCRFCGNIYCDDCTKERYMKDGRLKRICGGCKHQKMIVDIKSSTGSSNTQAFMDKMRATFSTLELENMEVMSEVSNQYELKYQQLKIKSRKHVSSIYERSNLNKVQNDSEAKYQGIMETTKNSLLQAHIEELNSQDRLLKETKSRHTKEIETTNKKLRELQNQCRKKDSEVKGLNCRISNLRERNFQKMKNQEERISLTNKVELKYKKQLGIQLELQQNEYEYNMKKAKQEWIKSENQMQIQFEEQLESDATGFYQRITAILETNATLTQMNKQLQVDNIIMKRQIQTLEEAKETAVEQVKVEEESAAPVEEDKVVVEVNLEEAAAPVEEAKAVVEEVVEEAVAHVDEVKAVVEAEFVEEAVAERESVVHEEEAKSCESVSSVEEVKAGEVYKSEEATVLVEEYKSEEATVLVKEVKAKLTSSIVTAAPTKKTGCKPFRRRSSKLKYRYTTKNQIDCTHFQNGSCRRPRCKYRHVDTNQIDCTYFQKGRCDSYDCKYRHVKISKSSRTSSTYKLSPAVVVARREEKDHIDGVHTKDTGERKLGDDNNNNNNNAFIKNTIYNHLQKSLRK